MSQFELKRYRRVRGRWSADGARKVRGLSEAVSFLRAFAYALEGKFDADLRLVLYQRQGRKLIAEVGGREDPVEAQRIVWWTDAVEPLQGERRSAGVA
jgi:hypothetical protein